MGWARTVRAEGVVRMSRTRWEQIAAGSGAAFVVLVLVALFIVEQPPEITAPAGEVQAYATENRTALLTQAYLVGLASVALLWFAGALRSFLRRAEPYGERLGTIAFGAGVATAIMALLGTAMSGALVFQVAAEGDAGVIRAMSDLVTFAFVAIVFPVAALIAATSIAAVRTGVLPRALGWAGGAITIAMLVAGSAPLFDSGVMAPDGDYGFVVALLSLAWVLATSATMVGRIGREEAPAESPRAGDIRRAV